MGRYRRAPHVGDDAEELMHSAGGALEEAVDGLSSLTLEELDARAALRRRVDTKYVVPIEQLVDTVAALADSYDVLEIERLRRFEYESVYFDTRELRCFRDHVDGRRPRFKARSRLYRDTGACFFEVKIRPADETIKRQCPYDNEAHGALTDSAWRFLETALREVAGEAPPTDLAPSLSTAYGRITLSATQGGERATIDLDVRMRTMDDRSVKLRDGYGLVETKSEGGEGHIDRALRAAGCEPTSISKYRLGVGLLLANDPESARIQQLRTHFA
jgi:hypothetical protein